MTNVNTAQSTEQPQATSEQLSEVPVTFTATIGELNGIFGAINASAFQAVMQPLAQNITHQIASHNIPPQQTQQQALAMNVNITVSLAELNTIFSVVNSTNFSTILKPILDRITQEVQQSVSMQNQQQPQQLQQSAFMPLQGHHN